MIELRNNQLEVRFPQVHPHATCRVEFQRTLRIPDDNQDYPLPAGLGRFPLTQVDHFDLPERWKQRGGVFLPMYQSEAMWINFDSGKYPFAVKVAAGKINAVTGRAWDNALHLEPQDYVVLPDQPWLDGFHVSGTAVRQFVVMPLGEGVTAEEQITGSAQWGGLQFIFYPMKAEAYRERFEQPRLRYDAGDATGAPMFCRKAQVEEMGLAPGGRIQQEIAADAYGLDVWDTGVYSRCFVHLLNAQDYQSLTGRWPPTKPLSARQYADAGIPWFDYYLEGNALAGSKVLAALDGVAAALHKRGKELGGNEPIQIAGTVDLSGSKKTVVRDGQMW